MQMARTGRTINPSKLFFFFPHSLVANINPFFTSSTTAATKLRNFHIRFVCFFNVTFCVTFVRLWVCKLRYRAYFNLMAFTHTHTLCQPFFQRCLLQFVNFDLYTVELLLLVIHFVNKYVASFIKVFILSQNFTHCMCVSYNYYLLITQSEHTNSSTWIIFSEHS